MTTLTLRYIKGDFVVTGPDIEPLRFKTRREAKEWCRTHYPGSLIKEIGPIYKPPQRGATSGGRGRGGLGAMTDRLQRFPNVFCDNCRKVQPMIFDVLEADEKNTQAAADIVCAECKSIMATLYASNTDPN
jgi:hypothetical protein